MRRPVADGQGLVDDLGLRRAAGLHGGEVDEGLERRSGLALGLAGPVELAGHIVVAAHIGADAALPVHGHQGRLTYAPGLGVALDNGAHGVFGVDLDGQVQGGLHHQVLHRLAHQGADLLVDPVDVVLGLLTGEGGRHMHRFAEGRIALLRGDGVGGDHGVQHHAGPAGGAVGGGDGAVAGRPLHQPGQQGRLAQGQL